MLHAIAERYSDTTQAARFTRSDLAALAIEGHLEQELSELMRDDGFAVGSGGGDDGSWSYEISDRVMAAADAGTVDELVAMRAGERFELVQPVVFVFGGAAGEEGQVWDRDRGPPARRLR